MALVSDIQLQTNAVKPPNLDTSQKFSAEGLTATTAFALTDAGAGTTVSTTGQFTAKSANDLTAWFQSTGTNGDTEIYISNDARPDWSLKVSGTAGDNFLISNSCSADGTVQGTALSITPAGAVGLGKYGATDALEINSLNSASAAIVIANVTDAMSMRMKSESTSGSIGTTTNDKIGFMTNATTRGVFDTSGNFGIGTDAPGATLDVRGGAIFNEAGAAVDFRIEGDAQANLLFVDGSADKIGIGTATPGALLDIDNGGATTQLLMCVNGCICAAGFLGQPSGHCIQDAGSACTQRLNLNFSIADVGTVVDDSSNNATVICINGSNTCVPFLMADGSTSDPISLAGGSIGNALCNDSNPTLGGLMCGAGENICAVCCICITGCYFGDGSQLSGGVVIPSKIAEDCTVIGCNAGGNVAGGATNVVIYGGSAGYNVTTADNIVLIGSTAALCMTTATDQVIVGTKAGRCVLTCAGNVAVGAHAFYNECAGTYNTVIGDCAGYTQKGATTNTFIGALAGALDSTGSGNVFIGYKAGCANSSGSCCLTIGNGTCDLITGNFNTGYVGIGLGSSGSALHVNGANDVGTIVVSSSLAATGCWNGIEFGYSGTRKAGIFFERTGNNYVGKLHFATENTQDTSEADLTDSKMTIDATGKVGIATTAPTGGFDSWAATNYFSDAQVAHGMTTLAPTTAYGAMVPYSGTQGGFIVRGLADGDAATLTALQLDGMHGHASPTQTVMDLRVGKANGTGWQALAAAEIAIQFTNYTTKMVTVLGSGNVGIGTTNPGATNRLYVQHSTTAGAINTAPVMRIKNGAGSGNYVAMHFGGAVSDGFIGFLDHSTASSRMLSFAPDGAVSTMQIKSGGRIYNPVDDAGFYTGASDDLRMYHDGSNSYLSSDGTGVLIMKDDTNVQVWGDTINLVNSAGAENYLVGENGGAVTLYHNNVAKLATTATGASINQALTLGVHASTNGIINAPEAMYFNIDSDDTQTDTEFVWGKDRAADTGGTTLMYLSEAGNLGIGSTTPTNLLSVEGAIASDWVAEIKQTHATAGQSYGLNVAGGTNASDQAFRVTNEAETILFNILGSGAVKNPVDNAGFYTGNSDDLRMYHDGTSGRIKNDTGILYLQSDDLRLSNNDQSDLYLYGATDGAVTLYYNNVERFKTTSGGVQLPTAGDYVQFTGGSSNAWAIGSTGGNTTPGTAGTTLGFHHWSGSAWTNPVNIDASGNVGIGTTTPGYILDIAETAATPVAHFLNSNAGDSYGMQICAGNDVNDYAMRIQDRTGTDLFRINGAGNVGINSTAMGSWSTSGNFRTVGQELQIDGGASAGGYAGLGMTTSTNGTTVGGLYFANEDNSNAGGTTSRVVAAISSAMITSDSNAGDDSGGDLNFWTKAETGSPAVAMTITSAGCVGIGTTAPAALLQLTFNRATTHGTDLSSNNLLSGIYMCNESTTTDTYAGIGLRSATLDGGIALVYEGSSNVGRMAFSMEGTEALSIDETGDIAIGRTSANAAGFGSGVKVLSIEGDGTADYGAIEMISTCAGTTGRMGDIRFINEDNSGSMVAQAGIRGFMDGSTSTTSLSFFTEETGTSMAEKMRIDSAGKVKNPVDSTGFYTGVGDDGRFYSDGNNAIIDAAGAYSLVLGAAKVQIMNLPHTEYMIEATANGAVNIYHDNVVKLATIAAGVQVTGTLSSTLYLTATSGMYVGVAPGAESETVHLDSHSNGAGTAALYIGNAAITVSSDYRAKRDIVDYSGSALDVIDKARVVEFDYIPEMIGDTGSGYGPSSRGRYVGTIAQEMKEWAPWAINDGEGDPEGEHIWKAEYDHVVPLLLKGIQELRKEINYLKKGVK